MESISLKYSFLILSIFFSHIVEVSAQTDCDTNCNYEFVEINDSTIELRVSINGHSGKTNYFRVNNDNNISLPSFQGRYKDCLVFMLGHGQHFRLLSVFQACNGIIISDDYEHTMCMKPDKKESYLFFYKGQPIKMTYNYKNFKVKFKKLRNKNKYRIFKGKTIISCNNKFHIE